MNTAKSLIILQQDGAELSLGVGMEKCETKLKDKQNEYLKFTREYYDFRLNTFVETQKLLANLSTLIEYVTNMKKEIK